MTSPQHLLETVQRAAETAADVLRHSLTQPRQIKFKSAREIVTDADFASDKAIQEVIKAEWPDHAILSEEAPPITPTEDGYWWIIDPIDGTTNFSRATPSWCISIAVARGQAIQAGVIYDLVRGQVFAAGRGLGATLNGQPIHVSETGEVPHAMIGNDWSTAPDLRQEMMDVIFRLLPHVRTQRCWGTTALGLAHVAAGFLDAYIQNGFNPWDVAAGILLVEEAGGKVTSLHNTPYQLYNPRLMASNGLVHEALFELYAPALASQA